MVWVPLFCIIIYEIQSMILRAHRPPPHLALSRPIQGWRQRQNHIWLSCLKQSVQSRKSWRQEAQSLFLSPWRITEVTKQIPRARSQGQKGRWKQAEKWIRIRTDRKVSGLISNPWVLSIPCAWHSRKRWVPKFDCLNGSKLIVDNASVFKWL